MFFRTKTSGPRTYLQVVENRWEGGRSRQRVIATLGRLDQLQQSGQLDALLGFGCPPGTIGPFALRACPGQAPVHLDPAHRAGLGLPAALAADRLSACDPATAQGTPLRVLHRAGRLPDRLASALRPRQRSRRRQVEKRLRDRGMRRSSITSSLPGDGLARRRLATHRAGGQDPVCSPLQQGSHRGGALRPPARPVHSSSSWSSSTRPPSTSRERAERQSVSVATARTTDPTSSR